VIDELAALLDARYHRRLQVSLARDVGDLPPEAQQRQSQPGGRAEERKRPVGDERQAVERGRCAGRVCS
jgi:hypothetical protein